ncbi:MAG: hypothetical protein HUU07_16535 [Candidatus Brocadia sinica]|nr:hypothetical protein [Candidatus Brocadia sinica]
MKIKIPIVSGERKKESLIANWKNDSALQREFTSFNSYASFMKAQGEGRAKIHRGCVVK